MGKVWGVGCVLWCVAWVAGSGHHVKNDGFTISITNAGAKVQLLKNGIKSPSRQDGLFMPS
jgi:hypothetical protein